MPAHAGPDRELKEIPSSFLLSSSSNAAKLQTLFQTLSISIPQCTQQNIFMWHVHMYFWARTSYIRPFAKWGDTGGKGKVNPNSIKNKVRHSIWKGKFIFSSLSTEVLKVSKKVQIENILIPYQTKFNTCLSLRMYFCFLFSWWCPWYLNEYTSMRSELSSISWLQLWNWWLIIYIVLVYNAV